MQISFIWKRRLKMKINNQEYIRERDQITRSNTQRCGLDLRDECFLMDKFMEPFRTSLSGSYYSYMYY
ncbi:unnamed protein product [Parnassius mnemosyne]|uniref:Uncharacterized protein n=1 Tax=Parnassius mnemosyne TaxID=213953 RepID=A0AAV1KAF1_9NEOP